MPDPTPTPKPSPFTEAEMGKLRQAVDLFHSLPDGDQKEQVRGVLTKFMEQNDPGMSGDGPLDSVGRGAVAAMDYASGIPRTAMLQIGEPRDAQLHDWARALNPFDGELAPGHEDYRRRAAQRTGQPMTDGELLSQALPKFLNPYAPKGQGALLQPEEGGPLDFHTHKIGDLAFDTLSGGGFLQSLRQRLAKQGLMGETAAALRAGAAQQAEKAAARSGLENAARAAPGFMVDPLGNSVEGLGKRIYSHLFDEADQSALKQGARPTSETLLANDGSALPVMGTARSINNQSKRLVRGASERVDDAVSAHANNPVAVTPIRGMTSTADDYLQERMGVGPEATIAHKVAQNMGDEMDVYGQAQDLSPDRLNELKKSNQGIARSLKAYDESPAAAAGNTTAYVKNKLEAQISGKAHKLAAGDQRVMLEDALDRAQPGAGGGVYRDNQQVASLLSGEDSLQRLADEGLWPTIKNAGGAAMVAGGLGGAAQYATGGHSLWPYLAATAGGAMTLPAVRSSVGGMAARYGKLLSQPVRAKLMEDANEPTPWHVMQLDLQK